jgi:hypothetical protein
MDEALLEARLRRLEILNGIDGTGKSLVNPKDGLETPEKESAALAFRLDHAARIEDPKPEDTKEQIDGQPLPGRN